MSGFWLSSEQFSGVGMFILDASERVISPGTFRIRSVVARNTRHYTPPSQKLSGQTTAEANMTRREGGEAQMRRFMDRGRNIKPTRFVDTELDKPWSDEMKALAEKIMEKWETRPRTWQGQVMDCVIQGRDVLVRAGTGAGKSLCFQALALSPRCDSVGGFTIGWPHGESSHSTFLVHF